MGVILDFIGSPTFQMDQVRKYSLLEYLICDIIWLFSLKWLKLLSGYQEKFYFNPGDTGFKVGAWYSWAWACVFFVIKFLVWLYLFLLIKDPFAIIVCKQVFETKFAKIGVGKNCYRLSNFY